MQPATTFIKRKPTEVPVYTPPGHDDTFNRRLIGWSSGAQFVEVILGEMGPSGTADTHKHDEFEQALYMLEGKLKVISGDMVETLEPGDLGFFPVGVSHEVFCEAGRAKFLVIYAPPQNKVDLKGVTNKKQQ